MVHHPSFVYNYNIVMSYMNFSKRNLYQKILFVAGKIAKIMIFCAYSFILLVHKFNRNKQNDIVR